MDLFYSKFNANNKLITINETDSKHITRSFRKNIGDQIRITNGRGLLCEAEILEKGKNIKVKVVSSILHEPDKLSIHVAISPLKNISRFEWFVEKATELGINQITPITSRYSEKKKINTERLERIITSSIKQSNQFFIPKINPIIPFSSFVLNNDEEKIMANLKTNNTLKKELFTTNSICILIGPEGGFSDEEINLARENNIKEITLGNNRLRSETAAIYTISALKALNI
jgi:16S rRNA (uracil1498-N3)-methyltransferase|tara:strand:- start:1972 stop:2661 length:690 start_codon:yes stop_codon:yes gene_type:complete